MYKGQQYVPKTNINFCLNVGQLETSMEERFSIFEKYTKMNESSANMQSGLQAPQRRVYLLNNNLE